MELPGLAQLIDGFLHQDFDLVGTIDDNVDKFVREVPSHAATLPDEVTWLLDQNHTEAELDALLDDMGCEATPPDGMTYRDWLIHIADRVRAATDR